MVEGLSNADKFTKFESQARFREFDTMPLKVLSIVCDNNRKPVESYDARKPIIKMHTSRYHPPAPSP